MGERRSEDIRSDPPHDPGEEGAERLRSTGALAALVGAVIADLTLVSRRMAGAVREWVARLAVGDRIRTFVRASRRRLRRARNNPATPADDAAAAAGREDAAPSQGPAATRPRRSFGRFLLFGIAGGASVATLAVAGLLFWSLWGMDFAGAAAAERSPSVVIEAIDGETFATKGPFGGVSVDPGQLPPHLVNAVLAIEDRRFYEHPGIDPMGVLRALVVNIGEGYVVQGGSTITQQLSRTLFLSQDRTLRRKLREAALALWLEARLTKDEILARYLGSIYMGAGVYGMPAAAKVYFDKDLADLTLSEAATLAGLIRAPSDLNPRVDLEAARGRASVVLDAMVETGAIDRATAEAAKANPAELHEGSISIRSGGWFADWVYGEAAELAGSFNGALQIRTTLHPRVQALAENAIAEVMDAEGAGKGASEAALVAMLPDGAVLAMVGGRDHAASQFNRATDALRQPGSTFKPFVYYAALARGWSMGDTIADAPVSIGGWRPENYGGRYHGRVTLSQALVSSMNVATVRLANQVGIEHVAAAARELGIDSELKQTPSLALGTSEVTLLDLTGAYASILAGFAPVEPWGILNFGTAEGERYRLGPRTPTSAIPPERRTALIETLRMVVERGTGRAAQLDGFAAGKTGTTQDHRDAWFIGFNGPFVAGVWVGNDDNTPMDKVTGGDLPARIWQVFMSDLMRMLEGGDEHLRPVGSWAADPGRIAAGADGRGAALPVAETVGSAPDGRWQDLDRWSNQQRGSRQLACNVRACERAYRSFRRSDCTFQPYNGPRKRCAK